MIAHAGLRMRLVAAFSVVALVAVGLASSLFVLSHRDDARRRELDRVAAAAPPIFARFANTRDQTDFDAFVTSMSQLHDVRVLLVVPDGTVAVDSGRTLEGKRLDIPAPKPEARPGPPSYTTWMGEGGTAAEGLALVTTTLPRFGIADTFRGGRGGPPGATNDPAERYSLVLAVPQSTIANAWLDLLPGIAAAAAIALVVAAALATVFARSITKPVTKLTLASQRIAAGQYDVDIDTRRSDEIGRLGSAFQSMALRVGESQSEMRALVANVSHDLKTPLTSILGFARALESGAAGEGAESRRVGGIIHEEAERLAARLQDLLYLSEIESGGAVLQLDTIDLGRLVRSVAERLLAACGERSVSVELELATAVEVQADGVRLERLFENLFANAARYTPEGGRIAVSLAPGAGGGGRVTVANTAHGLAADDLPLLFRRFYRRDRTRAAGGGTGLGLPIAHDIAILHGGALTAALEGNTLILTVVLPPQPPASS